MEIQDKFLTFQLGEENYAIPILKVKEIIGMMKITKVPKLPNFIKGVINLRGEIIPIIDLRIKFGLDEREYDDRTSIIVIELLTESSGVKTSGVVVDTVNEVLYINENSIDPPPEYGNGINQAFLVGMGKIGEKVIMLLNVDKILSSSEMKNLDTE